MTKSEKLAKAIRVITVPPVLVTALIVLLSIFQKDLFHSIIDQITAIVGLGIIPVLAYPLQKVIPSLKDKGRSGQRTLAFLLSLIGYGLSLIIGLITKAAPGLLMVYLTYVLSVVLLVVFNKLIKIRASGHSCSMTGPLLFLVYYIGWVAIAPCLLVGVGSVWSSLKLKRHTAKDLALGILICIVSFGISYVVTMLL